MTTTDINPLRALTRLTAYVQKHTTPTGEETGPNVIDVHFFRVRIRDSFNIEYFNFLFATFVGAGAGEFGPVDIERIKGGPSYIEWGGWIGDQGLALTVMAAGAYAGLWDVIIPKTLGIAGERADQMAGMGFVMTSGLSDSAGDTERKP